MWWRVWGRVLKRHRTKFLTNFRTPWKKKEERSGFLWCFCSLRKFLRKKCFYKNINSYYLEVGIREWLLRNDHISSLLMLSHFILSHTYNMFCICACFWDFCSFKKMKQNKFQSYQSWQEPLNLSHYEIKQSYKVLCLRVHKVYM